MKPGNKNSYNSLSDLEVNGKNIEKEVPDHTTLSDLLRDFLNLTGTHVGCDTSQCGACVIHLDGNAVKSCSMLAIQANNSSITTIEGLAEENKLHPVQEAFKENHGLQCGFCTPGMIMAAVDLIKRKPILNEKIVREELEGNLCRCTGYQNIVKSILAAAEKVQA